MILRLLFYLLAAIGFMWLWRRVQEAATVRRVGQRPREEAGRMVRDRVCQMFLPEASALILEEDGKTLFFCSPDCRDRHLREHARA